MHQTDLKQSEKATAGRPTFQWAILFALVCLIALCIAAFPLAVEKTPSPVLAADGRLGGPVNDGSV
jgi:hypothetical protein